MSRQNVIKADGLIKLPTWVVRIRSGMVRPPSKLFWRDAMTQIIPGKVPETADKSTWQIRFEPLNRRHGRAGPVCRRAFVRFSKTILVRLPLGTLLVLEFLGLGFPKRRKSLVDSRACSCPRLQAPKTA